MPALKKMWVFDGHIAQYSQAFVDASGNSHGGQSCVGCHAGDSTGSARAVAHVGFSAIPGGDTCAQCHSSTVQTAALGLHTTLRGIETALTTRGVDLTPGTLSAARYAAQCTKCHTANAQAQTACGFCHVSVPTTAGGGFLYGHNFRRTPSMDSNCTACHGSRVKDEFYGLNNALLDRNEVVFASTSPWRGYTLSPDVHKSAGMTCLGCHAGSELHGVGAGADRYLVTPTPRCTDCHVPSTRVKMHTSRHLAAMACQVCHAQPYKNCFGCHTDMAADGTPFYRINEGDPTMALRGSTVPDALMTFRIGKNPRPDRPYLYTVLRHVPVDRDVFTYTDGSGAGLVTGMMAAPTWKYATPHNIARVTPIQSSCKNCHDRALFTSFWLYDALDAAQGWLPQTYQADDIAANAGVIQTTDQ